MSFLMEGVNNAIRSQIERQEFSDICYGTVKSESPLTIETDKKTLLDEDFLSVAQHITDYEIECEITTNVIDGFHVEHEGRRNVEVNPPGFQKGIIKLLNHLKEGDRVILVRFSGGQRYQVIDRIGEMP